MVLSFFKNIHLFKNEPTILFFHGVTPRIIDREVQDIHLEENQFIKMIKKLQKKYIFLSMNEIEEYRKTNYKIPKNSLILQFDDGYENNLKVVYPILSYFKIPFTIFITTNNVEFGTRFPTFIAKIALKYTSKKKIEIPNLLKINNYRSSDWNLIYKNKIKNLIKNSEVKTSHKIIKVLEDLIPDYLWSELIEKYDSDKPLNWKQVKKLSNSGVEIGSHCCNHNILHSLQPKELIRLEIVESKKIIKKKLGRCDYFAYPNGSINDICCEAYKIAKRNYSSAFTSISGTLNKCINSYLIPRSSITNSKCENILNEILAIKKNNSRYMIWQKEFVKR